MSELHVQLESLKTEWGKCRVYEEQKHSLVTDLFAYIQTLSGKLTEAEYDLRDKKDVIKLTRDRAEDAEKQVQAFQNEKARHTFVSVLIDGDCMPFRDELVRNGMDGGKKAAVLLVQAVTEELQSRNPFTAHQMQVIVRIYANMQGLAKTYEEMGILPHSAMFKDFVRGFNMGDTMCDYVDAGNGKECSDEKVKAMFRRDLLDVHCHQIFFGGTTDNGYARLLAPFVGDETTCRRITLLEGPPHANELAHIKDNFLSARFSNVFRTQKLAHPKRTGSLYPTSPWRTPTARCASTPDEGSSTLASDPASPTGADVPINPTMGTVLRNKQGQRLDPPLIYSDKELAELKVRKLCNNFHLFGTCPSMEKYGRCQHDHEAKLTQKQLLILRAVARQSPCRTGLNCSNLNCISGHRCLRENCLRSRCWFPEEMHDVDTMVVA